MKRLASLLFFLTAACGSEAALPIEIPAQPTHDEPPAEASETPLPGTTTPPAAKLGAPYPVVLVHGMAGFETLEVGPLALAYWGGVVEDLAKTGEAAFVTVAPPFDTSEARAEAIAQQIDGILARTGRAKVNIVAHSQGGLDARILTSPAGLAYGDRVASVTTISTPHRGSRVIDASLGLMSGLPAAQVDQITSALLSLVQRSAYDLETDPHLRAQLEGMSEARMGVFNTTYVDAPGVLYTSYAGRTNLRTGVLACEGSAYPNDPTKLDPVSPAFFATALFLEGTSLTVNDGLVTVESARWGTFQECIPADHLAEIGMNAGAFDHLAFYRSVVSRLRAAGL